MNLSELREVADRRETAAAAAKRANDKETHNRHAIAAANHSGELFEGIIEYLENLEAEQRKEVLAEASRVAFGASSKPAGPGHYRALFGEPRSSGFKDFGDFLRALGAGLADSRLAEARVLAEGLGSSGGFLVPDQFVSGVLDPAIEDALVMPRARKVAMTSDTCKVAAWSDTSHASNLYGAFTGAWLAESATGTREYPALRLIELQAHKLALFTKASSELAADAPGFENDLGRAMSKVISFYSDAAFISGTGAGQPRGILSDPALISITSTAGVGSVNADDLVAMLARLHPACYRNALWLLSSEALGVIWALKDGTGAYLFRPDETRTGGRLLGLPVVVSEHCSQVGTVGDVILVDFSQYIVGLRKEVVLERTNATNWTSDEIDYRAIIRVDGMGSWESAITPKNSGDSLSWCVAVGTRS